MLCGWMAVFRGEGAVLLRLFSKAAVKSFDAESLYFEGVDCMLEDDEKETLKNDEKYKVLVEFKKLPAIQNLMGELYSCFHYLNASWNHLPEFIKYLDGSQIHFV